MNVPKVTPLALSSVHVPEVLHASGDWEELAPFGPPYWRPRSEAELQRKINATAGPVPATEYTFVLQVEGGRLVGECSLHGIDWRNGLGQAGICLWNPQDRRKGFGLTAVDFAQTWAFDHLRLRKLEAWVVDGNTGSLALFARLGWRQEATLRSRYFHAGSHKDVHVLAQYSGR
ncbi:GNAT family N-acetyltransferase [Rhodococcus sp. 05-2255-3B1]|uniref:GNAT family N-acetyltransferase n=1 Tax=unclassified Rhodococcus (in: high G+C Gram-positive bacteria) TaxID=192944 RepID=UPI000B9AA6AE|nr:MULTISPECIES: GNAT family protein [unclassified Rhodococcus (in: high G+C Gram-positive bacteria)]OZE13469.1 GNAT family N-acetyltransferase [Rhodococcus sp. 05-2255-3C]OZE15915.1 GNAT family N-acetyltransferase [Rhodococcus sp. 05-2255-3B1]OZE18954.1 GNAT family N-acetyltransferase [Rhodococcus sp. 05-2255-2A2]